MKVENKGMKASLVVAAVVGILSVSAIGGCEKKPDPAKPAAPKAPATPPANK